MNLIEEKKGERSRSVALDFRTLARERERVRVRVRVIEIEVEVAGVDHVLEESPAKV